MPLRLVHLGRWNQRVFQSCPTPEAHGSEVPVQGKVTTQTSPSSFQLGFHSLLLLWKPGGTEAGTWLLTQRPHCCLSVSLAQRRANREGLPGFSGLFLPEHLAQDPKFQLAVWELGDARGGSVCPGVQHLHPSSRMS